MGVIDLTFKIGKLPMENLRMIERHYFKNRLIKSFDFNFGFCIPESVNSWTASYKIPVVDDDLSKYSVNFYVYNYI